MASSLKILTATWKWYRHGGDWTYIDNVNKLYERHGHEVIPFSMKSDRNEETRGFEKYFVEYIDYKELNKKKNFVNSVKAVSRSIYSLEGKRNLETLLVNQKIDVAHLHNINNYITPSILPVFKKYSIPVIWTLHDYKLICPENSFVSNDEICENCKGGTFYHCAIQKCKKNSFLASSLAALDNYVHRYLNLFKHVDYFLCPSEFLYKKFLEFNFYPEKLVLTNYCFENGATPHIKQFGSYILFVGRLEKIKGVMTLLKAVEGIEIPLYIAGTGTQEESIRSYIELKSLKNVTLLGYKTKSEVNELIEKAQFVVCPSEWYENFPFAVIETLSLGTPVIGSRIGGIPELVVHEETGLLFEHGNYMDLREKILRLFGNKELQQKFGKKGVQHVNSLVNYEKHYSILKEIYSKINLEL